MKYTIEYRDVICEGTWPKTKKAALKSSIEKWKTIVIHLEENPNTYAPAVGCAECALCHLYVSNPNFEVDMDDEGSDDCVKCPIMLKTGKAGCLNTPYDEYMDAIMEGKSRRVVLNAARREVKFLESLLS